MKRRIIWAALGAAVIVVGIAAAWTQTRTLRGGHGPFWFHHGPMGFVAHELDLSDMQKSQIKNIWEGERPNIAELIHELASEEKEMDALAFQGGAPDESKIQDMAARQGATLGKLFAEKEKLTARIYSQVLNSEQRTKADELQQRLNSHLDHIADRIGNSTERQ